MHLLPLLLPLPPQLSRFAAAAAHVSLCRRTMAPENTTSSDATSVNASMMGSTLLS
jgi:hypothetical protein